jgi:predicted Zn finger-like uncharacterized protein
MVITCEACATRFRLDPNRIQGGGSKVRCSRCGHVFFVSKEGATETALGAEEGSRQSMVTGTRPRGIRQGAPGRSAAKLSTRKKRRNLASLLLWAVAILLMVAGGIWAIRAYFPAIFTSSPADTAKGAPKDAARSAITILDTVQAYFLHNQQIGQVFVVEGQIRNDAPNPVSFVLLEGKLFTVDNKLYQSQKFYAANTITREELTRLTLAELQNRMMNREGKDLQNVHVQPQAKIPYLVVFHNLPGLNQLTDYSIEVTHCETE